MENIQGKLTRLGNVVIDMHETARIVIDGELIANANLPEGSHQECIIRLFENATLSVKGVFRLYYGSTIQIFPNAMLNLNGGMVNCGTVFGVAKEMTIGAGFLGARNLVLYDSDHHWLMQNGVIINQASAVRIGRHVWMGVGATVLSGVTIGDGSVIGANSTVTKDIPPACLAVGQPARVIKTNISWKA